MTPDPEHPELINKLNNIQSTLDTVENDLREIQKAWPLRESPQTQEQCKSLRTTIYLCLTILLTLMSTLMVLVLP